MTEIEKLRSGSINYRLGFLLKDSLLYGGATAISRMLYVFIIPFLARIFTKAEYGVVDGVTVLSLCFGLLIIFGQDAAVARFFYETDDEGERKQIVTNSFLIQLLLSTVVAAALYVNSASICNLYFLSDDYAEVFQVMVLGLPFATAVQYFQNLLKWVFFRKQFIVMSIGFTFTFLILAIAFVTHFDMGIVGVFYAKLISSALFTLVGIYYCKSFFALPKSLKYSGSLLSYGWPFMLIGVFGALMPSLDRFYITKHMGLEVMAVYAIGFRISSLLKLPVAGFQTAWGPFALAIYKDENSGDTYNKVLLFYSILLVTIGLLVVVVTEPLIYVFASEKYMASAIVIIPLVFSIIIDSLSWITGIGISISKKTYNSSIGYGIGLIVTVAAILLLIEPYGVLGVAYGVLIGRIFLTLSLTILSRLVYPIAFDYMKPILVFIAGFLISLALFSFGEFTWWQQMLIRAVAVGAFIGMVWFAILTSTQKNELMKAVQKKLRKENVGDTKAKDESESSHD
ncbi:MAG TPA: hypothetical protein EYN38_07940 [Flavobacteriales bacterium]|nr:hypothetical protein [Flavobacteriales bacterium]HIA12305.1 hypothetical protein [Flavobacteriales bacterium]HIO73016.1 hypothetical protein [Flavobacteriales bacterium]